MTKVGIAPITVVGPLGAAPPKQTPTFTDLLGRIGWMNEPASREGCGVLLSEQTRSRCTSIERGPVRVERFGSFQPRGAIDRLLAAGSFIQDFRTPPAPETLQGSCLSAFWVEMR
jgi:hypothetical protein